MKYILCYGDSNTWGASPDQLPRFGFAERWPGILQNRLGSAAHIYENGLCGRTTGFQDDVEPGRNGRSGFSQVLEIHAPLDLVILMLGSNDCKSRFHQHPAWDSALNVRQLLRESKRELYGKMGLAPRLLLLSPVKLGQAWETSWVGREFDRDSTQKADCLAALYRQIAEEEGAAFLDAAEFAAAGVDCVHMSAASHRALGERVAQLVEKLLGIG